MTDTEIIKALEEELKTALIINHRFEESNDTENPDDHKFIALLSDTIKLINRQKAEIADERARKELCAEVIARQDKEIEMLKSSIKETNEHLCNEYIALSGECDRQKAEIDRLKELLNGWKTEAYKIADEKDELYCNAVERLKTAKAEAIKEFAERLKGRERSNAVCCWCKHADIYGHRAKECDEPYIDKNGKEQNGCFMYAKFESYIDNLVKEMEGW